MSGRPDPAAARWGEADVPSGGEPRDGDADDAEPTTDATDAGRGAPEPAADVSGREVADPDRLEEPRSIRGISGSAGAANGAGSILTDVAALTAERDDYLQSLQRLKADFDNYRKRVARLQEEQAARAAAGLVQKLLPVLDNLDLAVAHLVRDEPVTEDARALSQARDQLLEVLAREGLERVDATEVPFDPTVHDAVAHTAVDASAATNAPASSAEGSPGAEVGAGPDEAAEPLHAQSDGEAGDGAAPPAGAHQVMVDDVMRAGYRWRGQVLRPAMVRVRG